MKYFLFYLIFFNYADAFVLSKTETGSNVKWDIQSDEIALYIDSNPNGTKITNINSSEIKTILNESITNWNQYTPYKIVPLYTTDISDKKNKVYFSKSPSYFGSGVLAVTEINYNAESGNISSADIIINESSLNSIKFTKDESQSSYLKAYLGDVMTHELGHFFGLSHSEVINSSMTFSVFKNQHTVHSDDYHGVYNLYGMNKNVGSLNGKVLGGQAVPVFGVHVKLISSNNLTVVQSQLTDESGQFSFQNLALDDSYMILTTPVEQIDSISKYYSTIVSNYCGQRSFKPSFFSKCGPRSRSIPQIFKLSSTIPSYDVGEITIRCDENLDPDYLKLKSKATNREYSLNKSLNEKNSFFVGMFTPSEITQGSSGLGDEYLLDLSYLDLGSDPSKYYLNLSVATTGLSSAMDVAIEIKRVDSTGYALHSSTVDETGKLLTDRSIKLPLSANMANNKYSIRVKPIALSSTQQYEIFSTTTTLSNSNAIYLLSSSIGTYTSNIFTPISKFGDSAYDDNKYCLETDVNFTAQGYTPLKTAATIAKTNQPEENEVTKAISCATVDIDNNTPGPGNGSAPMSLILGFLIVLAFSNFKQLSD